MNNDIENLKKRLIYRSQYRGTKEMDKLVGSFVNTYINSFDSKNLMS
jgi:antitoxin CptB